MELAHFEKVDGIFKIRDEKTDEKFEKLYAEVRRKEGRLYSDDELKNLPEISKKHPLHNEWVLRKESYERLIKYLQSKKSSLKIAELGCGNGWLSARLAAIPGSEVWGIDINLIELKQAVNVFTDKNLFFIYGDFRNKVFDEMKFDTIVLAASSQYFFSLKATLNIFIKRLNEKGELHILDTPFYQTSAIKKARQRTKDYYKTIGFPEMAAYYFHHSPDELKNFSFQELYKPGSLKNRLAGNKNPFPWVCLKKEMV